MFKIEISNQFLYDLGEVVAYIAHILFNPIAAINLKDKINDAVDDLKKNAAFYPLLKSNKVRLYKYQRYKLDNYYIIYYIDNDVVRLARFIYAGRNFDDIDF